MTEINHNLGGVPIQQNVGAADNQKKEEVIQAHAAETPKKEMTQKDLGLMPSAAIGQSQVVANTNKTSVDGVDYTALEKEIEYFQANPEKVGVAMYYFTKAYEALQNDANKAPHKSEDAYAGAKAAAFMGAFTNEFLR